MRAPRKHDFLKINSFYEPQNVDLQSTKISMKYKQNFVSRVNYFLERDSQVNFFLIWKMRLFPFYIRHSFQSNNLIKLNTKLNGKHIM